MNNNNKEGVLPLDLAQCQRNDGFICLCAKIEINKLYFTSSKIKYSKYN